MYRQELQFLSSGCRCTAFWYAPGDWRRPTRLPTIVIVPSGYGLIGPAKHGECGQASIELAKLFAAAGFAVFAFDGRGQGISEGLRSSQHDVVEDLSAALTFLRTACDGTDPLRMGLFGQSVGGMAAILAAERDPTIRSIVIWGTLPRYSVTKTESPPRLPKLLAHLWEQSGRNKPLEQFANDYPVIDPIDHIPNVCQPVLIAGGSEDKDLFRLEEQQALLSAAAKSPQAMLLELKGQTHHITHTCGSFAAMASIFSAWFAQTL